MRGGFTLAAIGFRMSTVMIQVLGITQSIVQVGAVNFTRGYYQMHRQGIGRMHRFATERSDIMRERINTFDRDLSQITQEVRASGPLTGRYERFLNRYIPLAYAGMQHMQYWVVDLPTWVASYEAALRDGSEEAEAIVIADRDVRIAQGSGLLSDRGMLERGRVSPDSKPNEVARLFTVLGSYMFGKFNLAYRRIHGTEMSLENWRGIALLTRDIMLMFVVEATLVYLLRNGWPDEDDEEDRYSNIGQAMVGEGLLTVMGSMPIARDAAAVVQGFGGGGAYGSYIETLGGLVGGVADVGRAVAGDDEAFDLNTIRDLIGFGGTAFFLPSALLNDAMDALFTRDLEWEDDALVNLLEVISGLPVGGENE
jgi:hypothetical protein